jgi:hypothetical protein
MGMGGVSFFTNVRLPVKHRRGPDLMSERYSAGRRRVPLMSLSKTVIALVTTPAALALLGFAAPDLAEAQTPHFERKYIGTWCRVVSSNPGCPALRREPRGKICSPERRVVITATAVHGMFAPFDSRGTPEGLTEDEAVSVGKFEMMHCKVEEYAVNMHGSAFVYLACSNGEHLRGVWSIDGRELLAGRALLRVGHSEAPAQGRPAPQGQGGQQPPMTPDQVRERGEAAVQCEDAEVPAQYRGLWCEARDGTYYRCRKATDESSRLIRRDGFNITEEGDCRVNAVVPTAKGHRLWMRCTDKRELVNVDLRLDGRGRLHW